ncbi:MAG: TAT-variant-translocated molybdopterin oxidoreductase [Rhodothermaceae bacterium]|nr:TAT-variant-translocated molybdopterin oxidoreductase [Rhodothermaceae bacterium]
MIELDVLRAADVAADETSGAQPPLWRSYEDRTDAPGYAALRRNEFLPGATEADDLAGDPGPSRRTFLKVVGASMAMAGLTGCRRPAEQILPYVRKPEEVVPGLANFYATAMPHGGVVHSLLVQSYEGRPTKIEGNPQHPVSRGKTDAFAQASLLNLYDPDRSKVVLHRGAEGTMAPSTWAEFVAAVRGLGADGGSMAVLAAPSSSPTQERVRQQFEQRFPGVRWVTLHPHGDDPCALGTQQAFGRPLRPRYTFSGADVIVSFDADFLGAEDTNTVWNNREYAASRRVDERGTMSRLYAAESQYSITGGMADHRMALRASDVAHLAAAVAEGLGAGSGSRGAQAFALSPMVQAIVEDVRAASGRAAFVAGATQPPEVHALCAALNGQFGNAVVDYLDTGAAPVQPLAETLLPLVRDMDAGQVQTLLMLGTNPVYSLPAELNFADALANVPTSIHVGLHVDETAQRATWHIPQAHYLEAWGDGRAYDGTLSVIQPLIAPLYDDAHSEIEVLSLLATGQLTGGYDLVRETLNGQLGSEDAWRTALHDGFVPGTAYAAAGGGASAPDLARLPVVAEGDMEVVFRVSPKVYDGGFSNNAWMLELPHPVTKMVWDNAAIMSPATATALGVETEIEAGKFYADRVMVSVEGQEASLPVWVQPGHPDGSITVALGYGRELETDRQVTDRNVLARLNQWMRPGDAESDVYRPGPLSNDVGVNVAPLRPFAAMAFTSATVAAVPDDYLLVTTQDHGSMEGRHIVQMATLATYLEDRDFAKDEDHYISETPWEAFPPLWTEDRAANEDPRIANAMYSDNQWGMAIDLNACTGCNACVVACQSENNIQIVGKDQVGRGRELHWLRLDRYYTGDESNPGMVVQPMMCQHCEYAPCESVCPVAATSHSPDGINEMTYNRCIGTRYCSNNCPYKVRRFNFYNWTKDLPVQVQMAQNPNVTMRFRGVMEKCTYCVQRVRRVQQYAHIEDRPVRDGEVVTACQQACPADAIVFGDIADAEAAVVRSKQSARAYEVLPELNVKPRTSYLARLRNPNPSLVEAVEAVVDEHAAAMPAGA